MKKLRIAVALLLAAMICCVAGFAHPGKTDANGGHWDRSTGTYHYHHGYPAHQHTNGICPYDFDDQTGANSGSSSGTSNSYNSSSYTRPSKQDTGGFEGEQTTTELDKKGNIVRTVLNLALGGFPVWISLWAAVDSALDTRRHTRKLKAAEEAQALARKQQEEEAERKRQEEKERLQIERDGFLLAYEGKSLNELIPPPKGCYIGKLALPYGPGAGEWGEYTAYITPKGQAFHSRPICGSAHGMSVNLALARKGRVPCARCCKSLPTLVWYDEQRKLYDESIKLFGYSIFRSDDPNPDE